MNGIDSAKLPAHDSEDDDEDYVPANYKEEKADAQQDIQSVDIKKGTQLWEQLKMEDEKDKKKETDKPLPTVDLVHEALEAIKKATQKNIIIEKVRFAGQQKEGTAKDISKINKKEKIKLKGSQDGLDKLISCIDDQAKNISTLTKSKRDWNEYTEKVNIKDDLKRKRMDGHISKTLFLEKAKANERDSRKIKKLPI